MAQLIDTSVFISMERNGRSLTSLASATMDEPVALAAITASELLAGVHRAESIRLQLRREAFVEAVLDFAPVLPIDLRVARVHAGMWAQLTAAGHMIGAHDLLIAATAMAHGYSILTENVRKFGRVPGLEVRQPFW